MRKQFEAHPGKWFVGKIVNVDENNNAFPYFVQYDDEDKEDMTHAEATKWVIRKPAGGKGKAGKASAAEADSTEETGELDEMPLSERLQILAPHPIPQL